MTCAGSSRPVSPIVGGGFEFDGREIVRARRRARIARFVGSVAGDIERRDRERLAPLSPTTR
jgi:hypothetical protein